MGRKVVIAGSCRTALGKMGGSLANIPAVQLGAVVIREALTRAGVDPKDVDMVYMGCVLQAAQGQNPARQAAIKAGLPNTTPALTVNVVCGSGLEAVNMAARLVAMGEADVVVAGGMENMSAAPYALNQARYGYRLGDGKIVDTMVNDGLWDAFGQYHMGITAENVASQWHLSRTELDEFSLLSQQKAAKAQAEGRFESEIVPVELKVKKETILFKEDEGIRGDSTIEALSKLRPAFKDDGVITAGNASTINDGAAAVVVMSAEKAAELGIQAEVEWLGGALAGVDPAIMGIGPVPATRKALARAGWSIADLDAVELNEAFASQSLACIRDLDLNADIVNADGGAIALGHPLGSSGTRLVITLLGRLERADAKRGLATMCVGVGQGSALLLERP